MIEGVPVGACATCSPKQPSWPPIYVRPSHVLRRKHCVTLASLERVGPAEPVESLFRVAVLEMAPSLAAFETKIVGKRKEEVRRNYEDNNQQGRL